MEPLELLKNQPDEQLSATDALLTIGVCVAGLDQASEERNIVRLTRIALGHPLFPDDADEVTPRINRVINAVKAGDREQALDLGIEALPAEERETALAWAADMLASNRARTEENRVLLNDLAARLGITAPILEDTQSSQS